MAQPTAPEALAAAQELRLLDIQSALRSLGYTLVAPASSASSGKGGLLFTLVAPQTGDEVQVLSTLSTWSLHIRKAGQCTSAAIPRRTPKARGLEVLRSMC